MCYQASNTHIPQTRCHRHQAKTYVHAGSKQDYVAPPLDEAARVTRDELRAEVLEAEAERPALLPTAVRRVLGRRGSQGSALADVVRRAGALAMLRVVAVEALVLMEEMEVSREESASGSDCSDSLRRDAERCDASELLGALVLSLEMCLVALPSSQLDTMEAKRKVHSVSCADASMGEQLAIMRALPSPDKQGWRRNVSEIRVAK